MTQFVRTAARLTTALAAIGLSTLGCGKAAVTPQATAGSKAAHEAPPPPIEPALAEGSRLVDPRADELVRQMSDRLARAVAFSIVADEIYDEVPEHSPRRQLTATRHVTLRRPDRLAGDAVGDALHRAFWYDGKTFSAHDREQNVYATGAVPASIDAALDWVFDKTGTVIPLADFLYADTYARLMGDVQRGVYLGIHEAAGVPCHHLSFEQATIDWQLWIDAGPDPLPRKLVIAYKTEDEVPQYAVTIRTWDFGSPVADSRFHFTPPDGATSVEIAAMAAAAPALPTTTQETK